MKGRSDADTVQFWRMAVPAILAKPEVLPALNRVLTAALNVTLALRDLDDDVMREGVLEYVVASVRERVTQPAPKPTARKRARRKS